MYLVLYNTDRFMGARLILFILGFIKSLITTARGLGFL